MSLIVPYIRIPRDTAWEPPLWRILLVGVPFRSTTAGLRDVRAWRQSQPWMPCFRRGACLPIGIRRRKFGLRFRGRRVAYVLPQPATRRPSTQTAARVANLATAAPHTPATAQLRRPRQGATVVDWAVAKLRETANHGLARRLLTAAHRRECSARSE